MGSRWYERKPMRLRCPLKAKGKTSTEVKEQMHKIFWSWESISQALIRQGRRRTTKQEEQPLEQTQLRTKLGGQPQCGELVGGIKGQSRGLLCGSLACLGGRGQRWPVRGSSAWSRSRSQLHGSCAPGKAGSKGFPCATFHELVNLEVFH